MKRTSRPMMVPLLMIAFVASLSACSLMQRSYDSGYGGRDSGWDAGVSYREDRDEHMRDQAVDELGFEDNSRELNDTQRAALQMRLKLKQSEKELVARKEREQYFRHKPLMRNDRERIEFLNLPSYEARSRWLTARGISASHPKHPVEYQKLIEQNDITLGMTRQAVRDSWGEPELVEVAGNPIYGNERWKYLEEMSSPDGYLTEARIIYFESGRVVGWEKTER
ncbi:MAG: outer membrane protein assembly factor BamE [Bdellovibrionaceae bacterium]|nr:outer membrane protein assembly factor BamE [Pseudobdellovibrionaceae bacterium]